MLHLTGKPGQHLPGFSDFTPPFWFFVCILFFPDALTHLGVHSFSGLLNCKGGATFSLSWIEISIWNRYYLAVELRHEVTFVPMELPFLQRFSVGTFAQWGKRAIASAPAVIQLPRASQHCGVVLLDLQKLPFLPLQHCLHFSILGHLCVILSCAWQYIHHWVILYLVY